MYVTNYSHCLIFSHTSQNQTLPQAPMHSQAQVPAPQQMESIGGTTYFYTQQAQQQPAVVRI